MKVRSSRDGCWEWTGGRSGDHMHYGNMRLGQYYTERTHRVSWLIHFGEIPNSLHVLHHCDNVICVRPDHLFLGTNDENILDMCLKGRQGAAIITADIAAEIKREIAALTAGGRKRPMHHTFVLAARYGISETSVRDIIKGRTWKHVDAGTNTLVSKG